MNNLPIYDTEITVPKLTVPGYETRSYTWNPTRGSYVLSQFQARNLAGVKKIRTWIHRPSATWRMQIAATPAGHAAVKAAIAEADAIDAASQAQAS